MTLAALVDEARDAPGAFQPERAAAADRAGHDLPDDLLRGGPERAGLSRPAAEVYAHFGVPMPLMYQRAHGHDRRFGDAAVPDEVRAAARQRCSAQDEVGAQPAAEDQLPPTVEQALTACRRWSRSGWRRSPRRCRRSIRRSKARCNRRWARCSTTCRRCTTRSSRRPSARTRRCAASSSARRRYLPPRPPAGARGRLRLVPQPLRPGARRSAARGAAARHGPPLGADDLSEVEGRAKRSRRSECAAGGIRLPRLRWPALLAPLQRRIAIGLGVIGVVMLGAVGYLLRVSSRRIIDARLHGERDRVDPARLRAAADAADRPGHERGRAVARLNDLGYAQRARVERAGEFALDRSSRRPAAARRRSGRQGRSRVVFPEPPVVRKTRRKPPPPPPQRIAGSQAAGEAGRRRHARCAAADRRWSPARARSAGACRSRRFRRACSRRCWPSRTAASTPTRASIRSAWSARVVTNLLGDRPLPGRRAAPSPSSCRACSS